MAPRRMAPRRKYEKCPSCGHSDFVRVIPVALRKKIKFLRVFWSKWYYVCLDCGHEWK